MIFIFAGIDFRGFAVFSGKISRGLIFADFVDTEFSRGLIFADFFDPRIFAGLIFAFFYRKN